MIAGSSKHWQNDSSHPIFRQFVGELVKVCDPPSDESFLGPVDGVDADGSAAVATGLVVKACLVSQGVHQPRLAASQVPDALGGT